MRNFNAGNFKLESKIELSEINISYTIYGDFAPSKKIVWVCHALTANSEVEDWWKGLFGENYLFNSDKFTIICANILGSCYGTSFKSKEKLPIISIRDMAEIHQKLADFLEISKIDYLIGGSLGGMQALEWAIIKPDFIENLVLIATNAKHSAWGIAFNEAQRMALSLGENGIEAARAIALLSYRNYNTYQKMQEDSEVKLENFRAASYQNYQGQKLKKRFSNESYWMLSKSMDTHNLGRNRTSIENALSKITSKTLVIGIESDILFPVSEQEFISNHIKNSELKTINSLYGHDGFLLETKQITELLKSYFKELVS